MYECIFYINSQVTGVKTIVPQKLFTQQVDMKALTRLLEVEYLPGPTSPLEGTKESLKE